MTNARGWFAAAGFGMLALVAGCSSSAGNAQSNQAGEGATVAVRDVSGGQVLVNSSGRTLYTSDQEKAGGKILCSSRDCLAIWTPFTVAKGQQPTAPSGISSTLSTVSRPDGSIQVAFKGGPLYTFSFDHAAGDVHGDDVKDSFSGTNFSWHSATTGGAVAPTPGPSNPGYGY
jgi:predicted lipoprotein with Yx(FWY)xxD motif